MNVTWLEWETINIDCKDKLVMLHFRSQKTTRSSMPGQQQGILCM